MKSLQLEKEKLYEKINRVFEDNGITTTKIIEMINYIDILENIINQG